jgi:hypothetical protein
MQTCTAVECSHEASWQVLQEHVLLSRHVARVIRWGLHTQHHRMIGVSMCILVVMPVCTVLHSLHLGSMQRRCNVGLAYVNALQRAASQDLQDFWELSKPCFVQRSLFVMFAH